MAVTLHPFPTYAEKIPIPEQFTYPFCYEPHPLCISAANEVRRHLAQHPEWHEELQRGKMFGVLIVAPHQTPHFLAAFSGTLDGRTRHPYFVPPVFDLMSPGCYFQMEETAISDINHQISSLSPLLEELKEKSAHLRRAMEEELAACRERMRQGKAERDAQRRKLSTEDLARQEPQLIRQSQHQKAEYHRLKQVWQERILADETPLCRLQEQVERLQKERHRRSTNLQEWLFRQFVFLNALGEEKALPELFFPAVPPSGSGECCAPKLLQAAYREGLQPLCMAEFWIGASPADEIRHDGCFYPACNSKCRPILHHMLRGLNVEPNPLLRPSDLPSPTPRIIYEDSEMVVVSKPAGLLSVPGKDGLPNVQEAMRQMFPHASGPLIVHRLDMDTSGLMLIALTEEKYHELQELFLRKRIRKVYHALLEHEMPVGQEGDICLPLRPDFDDRPRQMVDAKHGKPARTHYRVLGNRNGHALLELHPVTGRTHQLRVHCAHSLGLGNPIIGDRLYGKPAERLMLHAYGITIESPTTRNFQSSIFRFNDKT